MTESTHPLSIAMILASKTFGRTALCIHTSPGKTRGGLILSSIKRDLRIGKALTFSHHSRASDSWHSISRELEYEVRLLGEERLVA